MAVNITSKSYFVKSVENDGRKFVDYIFETNKGDSYEIKNVLENADTNLDEKLNARALAAADVFVIKEHEKNKKSLKKGAKAVDLIYNYAPKNDKLTELYLEELLENKAELQNSIDDIQPSIDELKNFLGL